jgi:UDP-N-acetylglucosamine/UDP-N-acetylgalactosamine diphosphorylase
MPSLDQTLSQIKPRLAAINQQHLLHFCASLAPAQQAVLLDQIASLDLESLPKLISEYVLTKPQLKLPAKLAPARVYPNDPTDKARGGEHAWDQAAARVRGEALIRAGKVAAFVVAGGQGSRLGFEGPKGCYPAGSVTNKPLFQIFAEQILATQRRYSTIVPWYVMTSPLNHDQTTSFFRQHNYWGLSPEHVRFFQQGVAPSIDMKTGKVLLAAKHEVATNPDGHGGCVRALHVSGSLADMQKRGVEHLCYFQVDNPLVRVIDPIFLGLHVGDGKGGIATSGEMSSKMVAKAGPEEKVGVFVLADGKTEVLEYSDMPADLQNARDSRGNLLYNAGSIAIHAISVEFLSRLATDARFTLPWHRAEKKIPHVNLETGETVSPAANNGVKLEKFIFDALALCKQSLVYETLREEEFGPIKNATGVDSVVTSKALQTSRAAKWLEIAGVSVPRKTDGSPDCTLELSALTALAPEELRGAKLPKAIERGTTIAL